MVKIAVTPADFLLARIAEDEAVAQSARNDYYAGARWKLGVPPGRMPSPGLRRSVEHVARWEPKRVLAECEAKRRIVQACDYDGMTADYVLATMAEVYADHPDYDEGWRP